MIDFRRFRKDFFHKIFAHFLTSNGIEKAHNTYSEPQEFTASLQVNTKFVSNGVLNSFNELHKDFLRISTDLSLKSNMRLQKILLFIAILGVILTLYASNTAWANDKIIIIFNWIKNIF